MRRVSAIYDVVDWGLCVGCGACFYLCDRGAVSIGDIESRGIRPKFNREACGNCNKCLSICPGFFLDARGSFGLSENGQGALLLGPSVEIWEGYATDEEIRYHASSGGVLSALSLFCLEKENMEFVLHTGSDPSRPWMNMSVLSRNKGDLLKHTGSRYAPSSPCESLDLIERSKGPCVFIGKPCDAAAVSILRERQIQLDSNLGLVLTFFCAGPPSTKGTLDLLKRLGVNHDEVDGIRYRGKGWPGDFSVLYNKTMNREFLSYQESWHFLQKYRSFRCYLCPDGLGQLADISCGDAWHRYSHDKDDHGRSLVLVRSARGKEILQKAMAAGYLDLIPSGPSKVVRAQGLIKRRQQIFGRLVAMRMLLVPTPHFIGFSLLKCWMKIPLMLKVKTIVGTLRRLIRSGLWHRNAI